VQRRTFIQNVVGGAVAGSIGFSGSAHAQEKPSAIRIGYPGVGIGNRPFVGGQPAADLHLRGALEEEFKADGIKVEWNFLRGAGPAVNELFANRLVDISPLGDLPFIVGTASGLKRRVLATSWQRGNLYLVVPSDSSINSIKDIAGKKVAIFKGTNIQLGVAQILASVGLREKDLKSINMDTATSRAAIVTKDVDAYWGGSDVLSLRDQGVAKLVYSTRGDPRFLRQGAFVVNESFVQKYPQIVQRVVNQLVKVSKLEADQADNPASIYQLWTKSGVQFANFKEDFQGLSLKTFSSPSLDPYFVSALKQKIRVAHEFGLIKQPFELEPLIDRSFLNKALKDQGLENFWPNLPPAA
jgi:sulfonate transport system substrate-binding protein